MSKKPQLYKFKDIENRLHTLEPGKSYIKPFVTSLGLYFRFCSPGLYLFLPSQIQVAPTT